MTVTDTTTTSTFAEQLAATVETLTWADVPEHARVVAKHHVLDALGTALAATGMDFGQSVHQAGVRLGAGQESHVLGFGTPLPAPSSALVNGTLMHGLDFDDTHIGAIYHATAPALAAALAVGEAEHADGATVMLAYVIGLEVGCRLAAAGAGKFHARGFHPTGVAGTFAAACVTAKIRGDSADTLTNALGLCGSQAAGILQLHESWLKRMHPGWAAHSGIIAATLAEAGFRGPATVFEGPRGLYATHIGEIPDAASLGLEDLGQRWMTADIALKPYPCCHLIHAFADAAFGLLDEIGVDHLAAEDVRAIECPTTPALVGLTQPAEQKAAPGTIYDALFSVPYVTARALVTRRVDLAAFYDEPLDDPEVLAMAAKITCPPDPDSDYPTHFPGEVILHLTDGRTLRRRVPASHGTPDDPMPGAEVLAKFTANAGREFAPEQIAHLAELVQRLDQLNDVGELVTACVRPSR